MNTNTNTLPTLKEMKEMVASSIPDVVLVHNKYKWITWRNENRVVNWEREGLYVCYEAEKLLSGLDQHDYYHLLDTMVGGEYSQSAPWEIRLEALSRIFHPNKFIS